MRRCLHLAGLLVAMHFVGCSYIPITDRYSEAQSVSSPFSEFGVAIDDGGGLDAYIRDGTRNLRGLQVISYTLIDRDGDEILLRLGDVHQGEEGREVHTPSHYATIHFALFDPKQPEKSVKRPAPPFTFKMTVKIGSEVLSSSGVFVIKKKTSNYLDYFNG